MHTTRRAVLRIPASELIERRTNRGRKLLRVPSQLEKGQRRRPGFSLIAVDEHA